MSFRRLLRAVLLATLAFATAWGPSGVGVVASVAFVASCGPSASEESGPEQSLEEIARTVEGALDEGKADSADRPTILGDILPNMPVQGRFQPSRRFLGWNFVGDIETPVQLVAALRSVRPSSSTFLLLLWRPACDQPWRTVTASDRTLSTPLPTDGMFLVVSGPRNTRASGTVEVLLTLTREIAGAIRPSICPPGSADRPPVPDPLPAPSTAAVGTLPGTFAVSSTGAATYRIPLALPPGRAGVAPALALQYGSSSVNGLLGFGFSLEGLSAIERCARTVFLDGDRRPPRFQNGGPEGDRLCLDGQRLLPEQPDPEQPKDYAGPSTTYRLERDDFRRVTTSSFSNGAGPDGFRVYAKDGTIYDYGMSGPPSPFWQNAVVRGAQRGPRAWQLWRVADRAGNVYTIEYENGQPGPRGETLESRPARIRYTGFFNGTSETPGSRQIDFVYEDRPDKFRGFLLGGEVRRDLRLSRIDVSTVADARPVLLVSYQLRYPPRTDDSGQSRLEGVRECADALGRTCKPETTFKWQDTLPGTAGWNTIPAARPSTEGWPTANRFVPGYRAKLPFVNAPTQLVMPIDLDGDGRQDLLYPTAGAWHVLVSQTLPDGDLTYRDIETPIRARAVTPFDQDGDGRTDLLLHDDSLESPERRWRFVRSLGDRFSAPINAGAALDRDIFVQQGQGGEFVLSETVTRVLDEDGDGKHEILICQPGGSWRRLFGTKPAPRGNCMTQSVFVMDLQGVGRTDVLITDGADTDFFPGTDIRRSEIAGSLANPNGDGPSRERHPTWARTGDFNGDGLQDVLVFGQRRDGTSVTFSRLLLNRGDGDGAGRLTTFERADDQAIAAVSGPFNALNPDAYSVMDANLDGKQEVVAIEDPQGALVDFDGDGLADVLSGWNISRARHRGLAPPMHITEIRNGLVSGFPSAPPTVQIRYQPMVGSALTDVPGAPPVYTSAPTFCSLPRRCLRTGRFLVREVTSDMGGGTTGKALYAYEDARAIIDGRGWLGFAKRTTIDRRASVGTTTVTEFHNGGPDPATGLATDHRLAGLVRKSTATTVLPGGRTHVATTTNTWSIRGGTSYFPVLDRTDSSEAENGAILRSASTTQSTDDLGCVYESTTTQGDGGSTSQRIPAWAPVSASPQLPNWVLCLPRRVQLTSRQPVEGEGTDEKTRLVETEYDPTTHLAVRVTRDPETRDPRLWQQREIGRDRYGNATSVKVRRMGEERSATITFDAQGYFPTRTVNPRGHVVELRHHHAWGHLLVRQDENGISSRYAFDAFGWRALEQHGYRSAALAEDDWITHELSALATGPGYTVRSVATAGGDTTATFDALGRVVRSCGAVLGSHDTRTGARTSATSCVDTAYNDMGLVASTSRPYPAGGSAAYLSTFKYDPLGRTLASRLPNGEAETTVYAGRTATTTEANPQRSKTQTVVGERGEIVESTSGLGSSNVSSAKYVYGAFGTLRRIDRPGASTKITADAYGRRVLLDDPDTACTATTYNAFDEVDTVADHFDSKDDAKDCTDLSGAHTAQYFRDELGRVVRRLDNGSVETRWHYDSSRFGIGKISSTQSAPNAPSGAVYYRTHTYDALSRPQAEILQMNLRASLNDFYITSRTYDDHGRVSAVGYPSSLLMGGVRVEQEYDARSGALGAVYRSFPGGRRGPLLWRADAVDPDGQLAHETFGNRLPTTRTYDPPTGRQTAIVTGEHYPNVVQDLHYDYHPGGNLKWRESRAEEGGTEREDFTFDELNRLRTASTNGTLTLDVTYDALGNIRSKTGLGSYLYQAPRSGGAFKAHAVSQAGGVQLGYDTAGLLISRRDSATRTDQTIEYTVFGKPRRMSAAGGDPETFFEYDADETRVVRTAGLRRTVYVSGLYEWTNIAGPIKPGERAQSHRYFVYAHGRVVAEILRNIDIPSVPISYLAQEQVRYYHDDHLGSTHVITDGDGRRVESVSYDAFGARRRSSDWSATSIPWSGEFRPASIGFTGHEDDAFGLINMKGRIYDPRLGRFLQPDPIVQAPHYTQSLNRYSYVWNNPLRMVDPSGFDGVEVDGASPAGTVDVSNKGEGTVVIRVPQSTDSENPTPPGGDDPQSSSRGSLDVNTPPGHLPGGGFSPVIVRDGAPQHASIPRVNGTAGADSARLNRVWTNVVGQQVHQCIGSYCYSSGGSPYYAKDWGGQASGKLLSDKNFNPNFDFASWSAEAGLFIVGMVELPGGLLGGLAGKVVGRKVSQSVVYRGLAAGEDAAAGLVARSPGAGNSVASHVAGKRASQWISTTKNERIARETFGKNGYVKIDLSKVTTEVADVSGGIPGMESGMLSNWARKMEEVLVRDAIPAGAIIK